MGQSTGFEGVIGRFRSESVPAWPEDPRPPADVPNVVIVLLDDVGFAQIGCFGGSTTTPAFDALAARGIRYTNFHTTALCSPTRACVLTGRNHHSVGMGRIIDLATGFPGYDARIPDEAAMLPAVLTPQGWAAWAVGKWHLTPESELHAGATRVRWPLAKGFERFYGFMDGETNQFAPSLVEDNHAVAQPRSMAEGYHLTEDLVDHAIEYLSDLRNSDPDKPFLLYLTPGACHSPHQSPPPWRERFRGAFDHGWDIERERVHARQIAEGILPAQTELSPRPDWVPAWDSLSGDEQRVAARYMEAFAAYLAHTDDQIGRLLGFLETTGDADNTVVMVMSDNGASSEGGPGGSMNDVRPWNVAGTELAEQLERIEDIGGPWVHNNYPWGWTVAGNTPFRRWKRETHEGGVCDPLIVAWPSGIPAEQWGSTRRQYVHAIDVVPTVLDLLGAEMPEVVRGVAQMPLEGVSFATTLSDPEAPGEHLTQYFEMLGCRAIYHDGYKAVTHHPIFDTSISWDDDHWELYDTVADPSECHDLSAEQPERVRELVERWWIEAARHQVLPLDNAPFDLVFGPPEGDGEVLHPGRRPRSRWVYRPGGSPVPEAAAVDLRGRGHTVTAELSLAGTADGVAAPCQGVLVAQGSGFGGWSLYVAEGRLHWVHNYVALQRTALECPMPDTPGGHTLGLRYRSAGQGGTAELLIDGAVTAAVEVPTFTPIRWTITGEGLCCGFQWGLPVTPDYEAPFTFTGAELHRVVVETDGPGAVDPLAEAEVAIRAQ